MTGDLENVEKELAEPRQAVIETIGPINLDEIDEKHGVPLAKLLSKAKGE